jgi:predicted Zn-ribbon and HTH transcriptional regulator
MGESEFNVERREEQELLTAERADNAVRLEINGESTVELSVDEYGELLTQFKRTKWLTSDEEKLANESAVLRMGGKFVGDGNCHECGYEGKIVENDIGTTYCPKCRSTNVGWPVR